MTDAAFLSTSSPWLSELWSPRDDLLSGGCDLVTDLPFHYLDSESSAPGTELWSAPWDTSCAPSDISAALSDCSDDQTSVDLDLEERMFAASESGVNSGLLTSAAVSAMGDDNCKQDLSLSQEISRWQDGLAALDDDEGQGVFDDQSEEEEDIEEEEESEEDEVEDLSRISKPLSCSRPAVSPKKRSLTETLSQSIKWSVLTCSEQRQLVEDLSETISANLGLREQLEVIRILNPRATVSPTDTEFVIDMSSLSDEKLSRVQVFVKQHLHQNTNGNRCHQRKNSNNNNNNINNNNNKSSSGHCQKNRGQCSKKCCCHDNGHSCNVSSKVSEDDCTGRRRRGAKHPPTFMSVQERRRLERKRSRQDQKEKRSGLFTREQVLSVSSRQAEPSEEDDPDIDILT